MNTAQLYIIAKNVAQDIDDTSVIPHLQALVNGLNNQITNPQSGHLEQISQARNQLRKALVKAQANTFPKTWNPMLEELGVYDLLGTRLFETVEGVLSVNQITLDSARDQIQEYLSPIQAIRENLQKITEGLSHFELTGDELEAGESEVSVLVPRGIFGNDLEGLASEVDALNDLMLVLTEISTQSRESPKLRQISTTDPLIVFSVGASAVLFVLKVVNMLLEGYERVLKIRAAGTQATEAELDKAIIKAIEKQAETAITTHIEKFIESLKKDYLSSKNWEGKRENELGIELKTKLIALASRIDHGYRIEADVKELPAPDDEEKEPRKATETRAQIEEIRQLAEKLKYFEPEGNPILNLPAPNKGKGGKE